MMCQLILAGKPNTTLGICRLDKFSFLGELTMFSQLHAFFISNHFLSSLALDSLKFKKLVELQRKS